jgi:hypothetical protein
MRLECTNRDEKTGAILRQGGDKHALSSLHHLHRLLLALATGARPNSYDWAMMTHVASGLLPADAEFYRILARRRAERARAAAWQKEYRARQKKSE